MATIDRILELVNESGLTAKDFANNAGLAGGSITDWKTGRSKPSVESLQKIAKYANVQLEWLTGDSQFKTIEEDFDNYLIIQNKILILKTIERYHSEYVIPCSLTENDIDFIVELLSNITSQNAIEKREQLNEYVNSFKETNRKIIKEFINILVKELISDLKAKNTLHYFYSLIDKNKKETNNIISPQFYMCPVYGRIAAGQPNWAEECIESRIPIDPDLMNIANPEECFFLKVNGESMNKIVKNHSYALIRKQDVVENGEIAVVLVNGYDATLKKFTKQGDIIVLEPISDDPDIKTQIYDKNTSIKIIGKYIGKFELDR